MILQLLAATNFLLGSYDAYITRRRMKMFGNSFELNGLIKLLATHLGPDLAAAIGVLGPCVGWTYIFFYFNLPIALAIWVGYSLKKLEIQLASGAYEKNLLEVKDLIERYRASSESTLHSGELTPPEARFVSKEGK